MPDPFLFLLLLIIMPQKKRTQQFNFDISVAVWDSVVVSCMLTVKVNLTSAK